MKERSGKNPNHDMPDWKEQIGEIIDREPKTYTYKKRGGSFDSSRHILPLSDVTRISKPLTTPPELTPGQHDFIVLPPMGIVRPTPLVIIDNKRQYLHGDLANLKEVWSAGSINNEDGEILDDSGHYQPDFESLDLVKNLLIIYNFPDAEQYQKKHF